MTCRVLKLARQPYNRWLLAPVGPCEYDRAHLANVVFDAHDLGPEWHERRNDEAHTRRLVAQLEKLGHTVVIDPAA